MELGVSVFFNIFDCVFAYAAYFEIWKLESASVNFGIGCECAFNIIDCVFV